MLTNIFHTTPPQRTNNSDDHIYIKSSIKSFLMSPRPRKMLRTRQLLEMLTRESEEVTEICQAVDIIGAIFHAASPVWKGLGMAGLVELEHALSGQPIAELGQTLAELNRSCIPSACMVWHGSKRCGLPSRAPLDSTSGWLAACAIGDRIPDSACTFVLHFSPGLLRSSSGPEPRSGGTPARACEVAISDPNQSVGHVRSCCGVVSF